MRTLIYKTLCEICQQRLKKSKIFCFECQNALYYHLLNQTSYRIDLSKNIYLNKLFFLSQNPRNTFLIDHLSTLICYPFTMNILEAPKAILKTTLYVQRQQNKRFFEKVRSVLKVAVFTSQELKDAYTLEIIKRDR